MRDWLAERLWQAYPMFAGRQGARAARGMLDEGRIAVILDGLGRGAGRLREEGVDRSPSACCTRYAYPAHEKRVGETCAALPGVPVSLSEVLPERRSTSGRATTVVNA